MTIPDNMESFRKIRDEIVEEKASRYREGLNLWTGESLEIACDVKAKFRPKDSLIFGAKVDSIDPVELLPSHVVGMTHEVKRE